MQKVDNMLMKILPQTLKQKKNGQLPSQDIKQKVIK